MNVLARRGKRLVGDEYKLERLIPVWYCEEHVKGGRSGEFEEISVYVLTASTTVPLQKCMCAKTYSAGEKEE